MIIKENDIVKISVKKIDLTAPSKDLQTDAGVQKKNISHLSGRQLEGIDSSWLTEDTAANLNSSSIGDWNQFEANKRLFQVKSTYDENIYTKKLDKSQMSKVSNFNHIVCYKPR